MPALYAHNRFGSDLLPSLPADVRKTVNRFPQLFRVGLQGPDIFFYYSPGFKTTVGSLGDAAHNQSGIEFFRQAAKAANTEAGFAYLYGLLAHYAMDSLCHPYIHGQKHENGLIHMQLESEFERYLLALDGVSVPETFHRGKPIRLTRGECVTVAPFFPPATPAQINWTVHASRWSQWWFSLPHGIFRRLMLRVLKALGKNHMYLVVPSRAEPKFRATNARMMELYAQSLDRYRVLLEQLTAHMKTGAPLGPEFEPDFG